MGTESYPVQDLRSDDGERGANATARSVSKLGGSGGMFPREIFKFNSSEMAISASKTGNSNINL